MSCTSGLENKIRSQSLQDYDIYTEYKGKNAKDSSYNVEKFLYCSGQGLSNGIYNISLDLGHYWRYSKEGEANAPLYVIT